MSINFDASFFQNGVVDFVRYTEVGMGPRGRKGFVGWVERLNAEKNEGGI